MKKTFQDRISEIMQEKGITQAQISKLTGITQSSLSDYIKGKYSPKQDKIDQIAHALGVSPAYLLGWDDGDKKEDTEEYQWIARNARELNEEEQKLLKGLMKQVFNKLEDKE